jgi:hypothetical protein
MLMSRLNIRFDNSGCIAAKGVLHKPGLAALDPSAEV